ncbi:hypothetical protein KIPB_003361 [Kipferlia bialata]|uniref:EF-hand domain-containing protein n=1 Tax=Kipferlia bialata TaxID=797122 RepID=A0A9K3GFP7_9EUKA|nr:hypothetical protein KIPB_003361 [Kipferlia bialata]|eukprot:g3361.t1
MAKGKKGKKGKKAKKAKGPSAEEIAFEALKTEFHDMFCVFDEDRDKQILLSELPYLLQAAGTPASPDDLHRFSEIVDPDGTKGTVEFMPCVELYKTLLDKRHVNDTLYDAFRTMLAAKDEYESMNVPKADLIQQLVKSGDNPLSLADFRFGSKKVKPDSEGRLDVEPLIWNICHALREGTTLLPAEEYEKRQKAKKAAKKK